MFSYIDNNYSYQAPVPLNSHWYKVKYYVFTKRKSVFTLEFGMTFNATL